jgi:hypothetical protein
MKPALFKPDLLALGLALVAVGVLGTLSNLGRLDFVAALRTWWPLWLVVWGGLELVNTYAARRSS